MAEAETGVQRTPKASRGSEVLGQALACLADWPTWVAVAVLLLNDHWLKATFPSWWTGKASDFAGLYFFPFLILAGLGGLEWMCARWLHRRFHSPRRAMGLALALTVVWFGALKLSPWTQRPALAVLERVVGGPRRIVADPTDLIALGMLAFTWLRWRVIAQRCAAQSPARTSRSSRRWQQIALATATLAALATTPPPPQINFGGAMDVAIDAANPDVLYASLAKQRILSCKDSFEIIDWGYCEVETSDRRVETYRSENGGRTWTLYTEVGGYLWVDPHTPGRLFVLSHDGLYRVEAGQSRRLDLPLQMNFFPDHYREAALQANPHRLAFDPTTPDVLYVAEGATIHVSRDGGETWTAIEARHGALESEDGKTYTVVPLGDSRPNQLYALTVAPSAPQVLYAANEKIVLHSEDGGQLWFYSRQPFGWAINALVVHPQTPNVVYAAVAYQIWRSVDGADTWKMVYQSPLPVLALAIHPADPNVLYAGTYTAGDGGGKMLFSDDGGDTWTVLDAQGGPGLAISPVAPYRAVTALGPRGVAIQDGLPLPTTAPTATVGLVPRIVYADVLAVAPDDPATMIAWVQSPPTLARSTDGGQHWSARAVPELAEDVPLTLAASEGAGTALAPGRQAIYRFHWEPHGVTVETLPLPPTLHDARPASSSRPLLYLPGAGRWLLAAPEGIAYSDDDGQTWASAELSASLVITPGVLTATLGWPAALVAATPTSGSVSPVYAAVAVEGALTSTQAILRSDDSGKTWALRTQLTPPLLKALAVHPDDPNFVYGGGAGIYQSGDGGATWQLLHPGVTVRALAVAGRQIWAGTDAGMLRSDDGGVTWVVAYPAPQVNGPAAFLDVSLGPDAVTLLARPTWATAPLPYSDPVTPRPRYDLRAGWQTFTEGLPIFFEYNSKD
ncbi:MAG TPA: hypothetical protein PKH77_02245 [Anaerolineae bacterium]|nr:hypothetical protein [Anaerolineae bacterium]